ncbi:MAG TPA: hypothetical protein VLT33_42225 [Labilithrix sp.]|nr:hypothetical protein [Labilithrix sp.]
MNALRRWPSLCVFLVSVMLVLGACRSPSTGAPDASTASVSVEADAGVGADARATATEADASTSRELDAGVDGSAEGGADGGPAAPPYLVFCEYFNFNGGLHYSGSVVGQRGQVYMFVDGKPISGKSAREITALVRGYGVKKGTLSAAEVARLVELTPAVEAEPFSRQAVQAADMPGGGCWLLRAGATADALVKVELSASGNTEKGARVGPASKEARKVIAHKDRILEGR